MLTRSSTLSRVLAPASIAVVGASSNPHRIGGRPLRYLKDFRFQGRVYAVNPKYDSVQGFPCHPDIASLPEAVDLAVLMLSSAYVLDAVSACAERGIGGVVVTAAGFAEEGAEGRERQRKLAEIVARTSIRVVGPNTLGFRNHNTGVYATFGTDIDSGVRPGNVAVVTQSGGLGGYLGSAQLRDNGIGTRWMIDTGNEVDIDAAECVEYLTRDPGISVIGLIIEGCKDGAALLNAIAGARRKHIPVVVMKIGRSEAGARSVQLHTGALAGEDKVWDAAFETAGAVRARDESHFIDLIRLFDMPKRPAGQRVGVVTLSGGVATVLLDAAERRGMTMSAIGNPPEELRKQLPLVGFTNPLDASGQMANTPEALEPLLDFMLAEKSVDTVIVWLAYALLSKVIGPAMAAGVAAAARRSDKPVILCGMATPEVRDMLAEAGVALMPYPTSAIEVLADAYTLPPAPSRGFEASRGTSDSTRVRVVTGLSAEALLSGIPFAPHRVLDKAASVAAAWQEMGPQLVLKAEVPGLVHKTELGLVQSGIGSEEEARQAFAALTENMKRLGLQGEIVCQPQLSGVELFVGASRDPVFGPIVLLGLGGIFVETLKDTVTLLVPCTANDVLAKLIKLKGWPLLDGARGREAVDVAGVARLVAHLSELLIVHREIVGVDLNPILASATEAVAVDVVVQTEG